MRALAFKILHGAGASSILRWQKKNVITAICLHRISEEEDHVWPPMKPYVFDQLLKYCNKHYAVIAPQQWNEPSSLQRLIITFDDGYHDFMEYALPTLQKHKMPAV